MLTPPPPPPSTPPPRREEKFCRFCSAQLPDWRRTFQPPAEAPADPVMTVIHKGQIHVLQVSTGPEGLREFQARIRGIFGYDDTVAINLSFGCTVPGSGAFARGRPRPWHSAPSP